MGRIKGTAMVNVVKALRAMGKDKAAGLVPPHMQHYLRERVLPSSWYPEEDHLLLLKGLAALLKASVPDLSEDVFVWMGRNSAHTDMTSVYSSLVSASTPETVFRRGATLWQSYHDSGTLQVTMTGPSKGTVELKGYELRASEMCRVITGWFTGFLDAGGGKDIRVVETRCRAQGATSCVWEIEWR